jgi:hypothetical protein
MTGCSTTGPVQCGGCAGPGFTLSGAPDVLRHAVVTVCVAEEPCVRFRDRAPLRTQTQQPVSLIGGSSWEDYDGRAVRVTVRANGSSWQGIGTFDYTPASGSPCDCDSLLAEVPLEPPDRVSPHG